MGTSDPSPSQVGEGQPTGDQGSTVQTPPPSGSGTPSGSTPSPSSDVPSGGSGEATSAADGSSASSTESTPTQSGETAAPASTTDSSTTGTSSSQLTEEQQGRIDELDSLKSDGVITQEQYDASKAKIEAGEPLVDPNVPPHAWGPTAENMPPGPSADAIAAAAATQSPGEPQVVPEVRPQGFQGAGTAGAVSESSKRLAPDPSPHGPEEIAAANSEENKQAAIENSQTPNLEVGQRVQLSGDHSEAGRMAYVTSIVYKDGLQELLSRIGTPARRFAEVLEYVVITRDGRSDTLTATPEQLTPLEVNEGWGRGSI